jgi:heme A synthase
MNETAPDVKRYNRTKLVISIVGGIVSFALTIILLITGATRSIEQFAFAWTSNVYLALLIFSAVFGSISSVLSFPFSLYSGNGSGKG